MKSLHVTGCPFCDIFENEIVPFELYYPEHDRIKQLDDFVIVKFQKKHIVISTDHVDSIGKEQWGRMLYKCRNIYGQSTKLKILTYPVQDHWHAEIVCDKHNMPELKDLRRNYNSKPTQKR